MNSFLLKGCNKNTKRKSYRQKQPPEMFYKKNSVLRRPANLFLK